MHRVYQGPVVFSGPDQTYSYYPNGKLQQYSGPDGTKSFVYDGRGLVQTLTVTLAGKTETWTFDYDAMGRSFHVTYPDNHQRVQLYDSEGRLTSRCYNYPSGPSLCYTATYDPAGNPVTMSDPYGGSEVFAPDALNRLQTVTRSVNGAVEHVEEWHLLDGPAVTDEESARRASEIIQRETGRK